MKGVNSRPVFTGDQNYPRGEAQAVGSEEPPEANWTNEYNGIWQVTPLTEFQSFSCNMGIMRLLFMMNVTRTGVISAWHQARAQST